ncbi:MAG: hypothetical protein H6753_01520 [Candidatus Omnitrophica bacterium]|nr:hypothetical protein [Candidatus Omnitrophota bacterium]
MKASYHIVVSAGVALGLQAMLHSWPASLGCFVSGVLIDLDHYLEYYISKRRIPFRYKDLLDFCTSHKDKKLYLFFHGYEYLFILWILIYVFYLNNIFIGIALGLTIHLICDQFTNPTKPLFYFITYRLKNQFIKTNILSERYFLLNAQEYNEVGTVPTFRSSQ